MLLLILLKLVLSLKYWFLLLTSQQKTTVKITIIKIEFYFGLLFLHYVSWEAFPVIPPIQFLSKSSLFCKTAVLSSGRF